MFIVNTHFRTFHLSMLGAELGPKLRQKWADYSISTVGQLKMNFYVINLPIIANG